jgi:branched-chain amino acid transport system substrate-binding protein
LTPGGDNRTPNVGRARGGHLSIARYSPALMFMVAPRWLGSSRRRTAALLRHEWGHEGQGLGLNESMTARASVHGRWLCGLIGIVTIAGVALSGAAVWATEPIKIGMSMALTGSLAGTGKAALLATQMWVEDINAKGGLLGRPVKLICYDDQSNPSTVPGIYTKLIDVDKVDLVASGYATNIVAPAIPIIIQHGLVFIGLYALSVNEQFGYDRYFAIVPQGTDARLEFSRGFYQVALSMDPKPKTVAIAGADAEYSRIATDGARENARNLGLAIAYDRSYPPGTVDFAPIVRAIQATNPDIVFLASYPLDSVGMVRAINEVGLKAKMFGGGLVGLQYAAVKRQLGSSLNGVTTFDTYVPEPTMQFPGIKDFLGRYQKRAIAEGADELGFYAPPFAYPRMQVLEQGIEATNSLDQKLLAEYLHRTTFQTIAGEMRFGQTGEQPHSRILLVQYQGIIGNSVDQFKAPGRQVIVFPESLKSGEFKYPFSEIRR